MTRDNFERVFWQQYLMLEQEFMETLNYVEFDSQNFNTYSNKFAKILLQIGSEMDNVLRNICESQGRTNITDYANYILGKYPHIVSQTVRTSSNTIILQPYKGWNVSQPSKSLEFWEKYNAIKHDRIQNYQKASLEAVANGMAALFIIEMYELYELYRLEIETFESSPDKESEIFILEDWTNHLRSSKVKLKNPLMDDDRGKIVG